MKDLIFISFKALIIAYLYSPYKSKDTLIYAIVILATHTIVEGFSSFWKDSKYHTVLYCICLSQLITISSRTITNALEVGILFLFLIILESGYRIIK